MATGLQRIRAALADERLDHVPICPILHIMGAHMLGQPIGRYATDAAFMAECVLHAYRTFHYDGLQLSLGVATEAEAMGCKTFQPEDGLPIVIWPVLQEPADLAHLRLPDVRRDGRLPLFAEAISLLRDEVGSEAWIVAMIRGPLLMASQLRGVENILIDTIDRLAWVQDLLELTTAVGIRFGRLLIEAGAHAIAIGEATCSPDFISPAFYRQNVCPHHQKLVAGLHEAGCEATVMHICGQAQPIVADVTGTGSDVMDIDYQVDPVEALASAGTRMTVRGNIDPVNVLLFGTPQAVEQHVDAIMSRLGGRGRFILGSGCDVPPDTPVANIEALVRAGRRY